MIFSRYAVSFFIILAELTVYFLTTYYFSTLSVPAFIVFMAINLIAAIIVINRDTNPEYKASWLAVIIALPFLGLVLYILFYSRRASKKHIPYFNSIYENIYKTERENKNSIVLSALKSTDTHAYGKAKAVSVKTGLRTDAQIQIIEGLQLGDTIITSGTLQLREGLPVELDVIE